MAYIDWSDDLSVGVTQFDEAHKKLIIYVNRLHQGMVSGLGVASMTDILDGLLDYTKTHFKSEEELMTRFSYPAYAQHKKEHENLIMKVVDFHDQLNQGKGVFTLSLMGFLRDWLINHIMGTDLKYRDFFRSNGIS